MKKEKKLSEEEEFAKYLEKIEDPNYQGGAYDLPENPTNLERMKYDICQTVLSYKLVNKLTTQKIAEKIQLSKAETEDILFCRIERFTLDRLIDYTSKLLSFPQIKIVMPEISKVNQSEHSTYV